MANGLAGAGTGETPGPPVDGDLGSESDRLRREAPETHRFPPARPSIATVDLSQGIPDNPANFFPVSPSSGLSGRIH